MDFFCAARDFNSHKNRIYSAQIHHFVISIVMDVVYECYLLFSLIISFFCAVVLTIICLQRYDRIISWVFVYVWSRKLAHEPVHCGKTKNTTKQIYVFTTWFMCGSFTNSQNQYKETHFSGIFVIMLSYLNLNSDEHNLITWIFYNLEYYLSNEGSECFGGIAKKSPN